MHRIITGVRFSANVPPDALAFLDAQVEAGKYTSRSAAVAEELYLIRDAQIRVAYEEAFGTLDTQWESVVADGVGDEKW